MDEETGLYYHGARYYIPWLARWSASDPMQSKMPTWSSYNYGFCNPITWQDSTGMEPDGNEELIAKVENNTTGIKKGDIIIDEATGKPELDENGNPLKWQVGETVITEDRPEWIPEGVTFEGKMEEFYQEMLQEQGSHWLGISADQGLKNYFKEQAQIKAENYFNFDLPSQYYQDKFVGFLNRNFNPHGNTYKNAEFKVSQEAGTVYSGSNTL